MRAKVKTTAHARNSTRTRAVEVSHYAPTFSVSEIIPKPQDLLTRNSDFFLIIMQSPCCKMGPVVPNFNQIKVLGRSSAKAAYLEFRSCPIRSPADYKQEKGKKKLENPACCVLCDSICRGENQTRDHALTSLMPPRHYAILRPCQQRQTHALTDLGDVLESMTKASQQG